MELKLLNKERLKMNIKLYKLDHYGIETPNPTMTTASELSV